MTGAVGRRYARALFSLAKETAVLQPTADELARVADVAEDPAVGSVLRSPLLAPQRRTDLVDLLTRELRLSDLLARFLKLLAAHHRLAQLPAIQDHFQRLLDAELGRVRVRIRSAGPLDAAQQQALVDTFATITGKQVLATIAIDADLLGGVVVEVEGRVYDGSVRAQLERLAKEIAGISSF
jgi:F-type H+-transporting ATPase subunit delta